MSLFAPPHLARRAPVVMQVHGGGWEKGTRFERPAQSGTIEGLLADGFVVASVDYRLSPANPWPDQIIDVKCAVRYLRAHATALDIDPHRIGAWGSSAVGQLVSLLGTTGPDAGWDIGRYRQWSSSVEAVVDEFGPSDLTSRSWPAYTAGVIHQVFGSGPGRPSPTLVAASPVDHVGRGDPPFLIVQGTSDRVVPPVQSTELDRRLLAERDPAALLMVAHGTHGLAQPGEEPSPAQVSRHIVDFFQRVLGPRTPVTRTEGTRTTNVTVPPTKS